MGLYSQELGYDRETLPYNSIYDLYHDDTLSSYSEDVTENMYAVIIETSKNYGRLMSTLYYRELAIEEDAEIITEMSINDIVLGIKKFLVKLWRAIAGMFNSFMRVLDKYILNDKAFINKYKDKLLHNKLDGDFSFTGHRFTLNDQEINNAIHMLEYDPLRHGFLGSPSSASTSSAPSDNNLNQYGEGKINIEEAKARMDKDLEVLRAKVLKTFSTNPKKNVEKESEKDFYDDIAACFRNGHEKDDKDELKMADIDINAIITEMTDYRKTKRTLNTAFREGKKVIDDAVKAAETKQKELLSKSDEDEKFRAQSYQIGYTQPQQQSPPPPNPPPQQQQNSNKNGKQQQSNPQQQTQPQQPTQPTTPQQPQRNESNHNGSKRDKKQMKLDMTRELSYYMSWHYRSKTALTTIEGNVIRALKERSKQYKAMVTSIVTYEPSKSESYFFEQAVDMHLDDIQFK